MRHMGEMGAVGETQKIRLKCEIWERWGATYGRNGVGGRNSKIQGRFGSGWRKKKSRLLTECSASDHAVLMIHAVLISLAADRRKPLSTAAPSAPPPKKLAPQKLAPQKLAPQKLAPHGPTPWGDRVHLPS